MDADRRPTDVAAVFLGAAVLALVLAVVFALQASTGSAIAMGVATVGFAIAAARRAGGQRAAASGDTRPADRGPA